MKFQRTLLGVAAFFLIVGGIVSSGVFGLNWKFFEKYIRFPNIPKQSVSLPGSENVRVVTEESVIIDVVIGCPRLL